MRYIHIKDIYIWTQQPKLYTTISRTVVPFCDTVCSSLASLELYRQSAIVLIVWTVSNCLDSLNPSEWAMVCTVFALSFILWYIFNNTINHQINKFLFDWHSYIPAWCPSQCKEVRSVFLVFSWLCIELHTVLTALYITLETRLDLQNSVSPNCCIVSL